MLRSDGDYKFLVGRECHAVDAVFVAGELGELGVVGEVPDADAGLVAALPGDEELPVRGVVHACHRLPLRVQQVVLLPPELIEDDHRTSSWVDDMSRVGITVESSIAGDG